MNETPSSWADLPQDLLYTITTFLVENALDVQSFRSVCRSWHASSPTVTVLHPCLPFTLCGPPQILCNNYASLDRWCFLSVTVIYSLNCPVEDPLFTPTNWLLFLDQFNPGKVSISHPLSYQSYNMPMNFPKTINLLDYNARELGRFYNLTAIPMPCAKYPKPVAWSAVATKVIVLSNMSVAILLTEDGKIGHRVGDQEWVVVHDGKGFRFDDIVEFNGMVLGVDRRGRLYDINVASKAVNLILPSSTGGGGRRKRLVESSGKLFLVVRCGANDFEVYEYPGIGKKKWAQASELGDRSFLFGVNFSISISNDHIRECNGYYNCIIFKELSFRKYNGEYDDLKMLQVLSKNELRILVYRLGGGACIHPIGSFPGYSDVLWPPPSWLWSIDRSQRLARIEHVVDQLLMRIPESLKAKFVKLLRTGYATAYFNSRQQNWEELCIFDEGLYYKTMLSEMKEQDKLLIFMEYARRSFEVLCSNEFNQIQASNMSAEDRLQCMQQIANARNRQSLWESNNLNLGEQIDLKKRIREFTASILSLEENISEFKKWCRKKNQLSMLVTRTLRNCGRQ